MFKYGYNPDEHFQTKVTLIDKDGFHKESDEVPSGESSNGESSSEVGLLPGIYFTLYDGGGNNSNHIIFPVTVILDSSEIDSNKIDHLFCRNGSAYMFVYTGEAIDDSLITIDWDELGPYVNGNLIDSIVLQYTDLNFVKTKDNYITAIGWRDTEKETPIPSFYSLEPGTPIHIIISWAYYVVDNNSGQDFMQFHMLMPDLNQGGN